MRKFIDIINEASRAPLYHFTDLESLFYILEAGKIYASLFGSGKVSLTRDKNLNFRGLATRIEVDGNRLRHTRRVEPFDFWGKFTISGDGYEAEERVSGDIPASLFMGITIYELPERHITERTNKWRAEIAKMAHKMGIPLVDHNVDEALAA